MFNASHLYVQSSFTSQPSSSTGGGPGSRPDPEFLNEGERVDVLPAPFLSLLKLFMWENHDKQNINHSRVFFTYSIITCVEGNFKIRGKVRAEVSAGC